MKNKHDNFSFPSIWFVKQPSQNKLEAGKFAAFSENIGSYLLKT